MITDDPNKLDEAITDLDRPIMSPILILIALLVALIIWLVFHLNVLAGIDTWQPPIPGDYECRLHDSNPVEEASLVVETWRCTQTEYYFEDGCSYLTNVGWTDRETWIETSRILYDCTQHRRYIPILLIGIEP